jgi:hypothetical protein
MLSATCCNCTPVLAAGVQRRHQAARRRARHQIGPYARFLQHLDHAHVGKAARAHRRPGPGQSGGAFWPRRGQVPAPGSGISTWVDAHPASMTATPVSSHADASDAARPKAMRQCHLLTRMIRVCFIIARIQTSPAHHHDQNRLLPRPDCRRQRWRSAGTSRQPLLGPPLFDRRGAVQRLHQGHRHQDQPRGRRRCRHSGAPQGRRLGLARRRDPAGGCRAPAQRAKWTACSSPSSPRC